MKKAAIITLVLLFVLIPGCGKTPPVPEEGSTAEQTEETTLPPEDEKLVLVSEGKSDFCIYINLDESPVVSSTKTFVAVFKKRTGVELDFKEDFTRDIDSTLEKFEILIGNTNRPASAEFIASLPENGYGYLVTGRKLLIAGKDVSLTALALNAFENQVLYDRAYGEGGELALPVGLTKTYTKSSHGTVKDYLKSSNTVEAYIENSRQIGLYGNFRAAQGAATDGEYFYSILLNKEKDGAQTDVIKKVKIEGDIKENVKAAQLSGVLQLSHGNDMCYNPDEKILVVANMDGKKLTVIDPETLTVSRTVDAATLPGTAYAIAYNSSRKSYVIAAGGVLNITDSEFRVQRSIPIHSEPDYVGQGMDCDDDFIMMPLSGDGSKTRDNIISVYTWDGYLRTVHMRLQTESETIMNWGGKYYINFNQGGSVIADLKFAYVY